MRFDLVDRVLEASPSGATTLKSVSLAEEYLQDHFPGFPVLPGVLMLEAMVQAARLVGAERGHDGHLLLGEVRGLKYHRFVTPGSTIRVSVELAGEPEGGGLEFRGRAELVESGVTVGQAATGRFTLRPARVGTPRVGAASSGA
jgi:3-hydroxyacyl-[acyl-carrier-protein] dehydratase